MTFPSGVLEAIYLSFLAPGNSRDLFPSRDQNIDGRGLPATPHSNTASRCNSIIWSEGLVVMDGGATNNQNYIKIIFGRKYILSIIYRKYTGKYSYLNSKLGEKYKKGSNTENNTNYITKLKHFVLRSICQSISSYPIVLMRLGGLHSRPNPHIKIVEVQGIEPATL